MPILNTQDPVYRSAKTLEELIDNFKGGLNTLLASTEISKSELAQADNLYLVGKGIPKKRGGTANYFLTGASVATGTQRVRGLKGIMFASGVSGVNELVALSDEGVLVRKSSASYAVIPGYSYASGYNMEIVQAFNNVYLANGNNNLTYYSGVTIFPFTAQSRPTSLTATQYSGATGTFTYSWRVSATNAVGETLATEAVTLGGLPQSLTSLTVRLAWAMSTPTPNVVGYNIYGRQSGLETFITSVNGTSNQYIDDGSTRASILSLPQTADTTTGPIYKYHVFNKDKLVGANVSGKPSRVVWSGGGANNITKFHWSYGGGYVDINADSGEEITGLADSFDRVIVFMSRSIWSVTFVADQNTGIVIPIIKLITRNLGCVSHRTIKAVDNDILFLSRRGVFGLGLEPNIAGDTLRTNEASAKVRTFFSGIDESQFVDTCATYHDNKYRITRPDGKEIIFDRERLAWMGPNSYPASPGIYETYFDEGNNEVLVWGDRADNFVTDFSNSYVDDKGVAISSRLLTKKHNFGDPYLFKEVKDIFLNFRNIVGNPNVDIVIEDRTGASTTSKSFSVGASSSGVGWGYDRWGTARWGNTAGAGSAANSNDLVRRVVFNKAARLIQLDIRTTGGSDNYELLSLKFKVRPLPQGVIPLSWNV